MGVVLKFIIVILGIYWLGKLVIKSVISYFLGGAARNVNEQIRQQQQQQQQQEMSRKKKKKEGNVTINYQPKPNKNFSEDDGDYVDFEEVK